jgi:hypothetical protein
MTTEKLKQILSKITCNGMRELTEERAFQAMTEAVNAAIDECEESAEVELTKNGNVVIKKLAYPHFDGWEVKPNKHSITKNKITKK